MSRTDPRFFAAPVRIGHSQAVEQARVLRRGMSRTADGADRFEVRQGDFASVPLRLRLDKGAGPNGPQGQEGVIAGFKARRKQGYPPIATSAGESNG